MENGIFVINCDLVWRPLLVGTDHYAKKSSDQKLKSRRGAALSLTLQSSMLCWLLKRLLLWRLKRLLFVAVEATAVVAVEATAVVAVEATAVVAVEATAVVAVDATAVVVVDVISIVMVHPKESTAESNLHITYI